MILARTVTPSRRVPTPPAVILFGGPSILSGSARALASRSLSMSERHADDTGAESTAMLLAHAQAGDPRALEELLRRYRPRLRRWASGRLPRRARHQEDTDDLVQEALIQTVTRMENLRESGTFHGYVRTAILNRIRNHLRHADVRERGVGEVPTPKREPSPLEETIGIEALERYEQALQSLSPSDREIVIGHVEMGLSMPELADATGKPTANAARVALQRALMRLAEAMDSAGGGAS